MGAEEKILACGRPREITRIVGAATTVIKNTDHAVVKLLGRLLSENAILLH